MTEILGIHIVDHIVIAAYLLGITFLGVWVGRSIHSLEEYFQGGRRFGRAFMIMFAFGSGTHSDQAVGVISKTYTNGLSGIWYQWLWLFGTPFYWLIAPIIRRMRALTNADYFAARFSPAFGMFYCLVASLIGVITMGTMLQGSGKIIEAASGGQIPYIWVLASMTILFVTYGVIGGLAAAIATDFIQGILTIVLSFLMLPFALAKVGGFSGLHEKITDPHMFSLVAPGEITTFYVVMLCINSLFVIVGQSITQAICGAGKSEYESRVGFTYGNFIKRICTVAWCFTGLCAVVLYPTLDDPDHTFGRAARDLLPAVAPGLLGLLIASVLASVMSTCDVLMNATAGLLTNNVYRPLIAPNKSDWHYVNFGRVVSVLTVAAGLWAAFRLESVIKGLEYFWQIGAMMGIPFWLGVLWRRTTTAGAWVSALSSIAVGWVLLQPWAARAIFPVAEFAVVYDAGKDLYSVLLPWRMLAYLVTGLGLGILVSYLTPRMPEERLDRFYDLLKTPIQPGEVLKSPCRLPDNVSPQNPRKLFPNTDIEIYEFTRTDKVGFLLAWVIVIGIILSVKFLAQLGA